MSIQNEIDRIANNVADAYSAVEERGGTVPETANSDNLTKAIRSIPTIPSGGIIIWSGASNAVPEGWAICDGSNGTPDLRGRFVLGNSSSHEVGSTGGSEEVTLTVEQMPSHKHYFQATSAVSNGSMDIVFQKAQKVPINIPEATTNYAGSSQPHPNMPPYYVLCYIMKL